MVHLLRNLKFSIKNSWVKEKYNEQKESAAFQGNKLIKDKTNHNLSETATVVLRRNFVALNAYIDKNENVQFKKSNKQVK